MRNTKITVSLFLFLLTSFSSIAQAFDKEKLLGSFFSIVMIRGYNPDGSLAYGSGVVVAQNKVVTNCHIFRQTKEPWISRGEDSFTIASIQADRYHDLCLVTADNLPFPPAVIGSASTMNKGEEIIAIGHSSASPAPITSFGVLKSLYPYEGAQIIRSSARFAMGASGSGLFDGEGKLIGINTFKTPGRNAYFYALPIEWLASLEKQPAETQYPIDGKTFWEEEDANKPLFMQIAEPEIQEDWARLSGVAQKWVKKEPNNTEAWYELGVAQEHSQLKADAEKSYRHALMLSKGNIDALFRLGVLAAEKGNISEVQSIKLAISNINTDTAEEFNQAITCGENCEKRR
ncbi:MAG: trypsin-like peptidase domain-containing protein [Candidatus Methylopumilus sp.]